MTNVVEPRAATADGDDNELATLVRRWMGARRGGALRVAQEPKAPDAKAPAVKAPLEPPDAKAPDVKTPDVTERPAPVPAARVLPRRPVADELDLARRVAVLIDARRITADAAAGLLDRLPGRGAVTVCRAYADWSRSDLGSWVDRLRRQGLHSFHQLAGDDEQTRVALAIDAVDIAREAAVDEVVLAGDMTSMLPLLHRLHAAGVRVVVVGPGHTPHDVRAACDEFVDEGSLVGEPAMPAGRHRA
ncbi:NYN domain-containing protein [Nocardioides sp. zg-1230]|uniref:NYN domain-containing protein n=1 Tax=Nocardioides sp. zg-1230 TaxID=2736601 RepID=UPI001552250E|nr:NYN domain-containing protein [Nocardioides sp. zg-1230]NPC41074.1 NYN domain-containing protein [Nocardioides sp. zg-1230]